MQNTAMVITINIVAVLFGYLSGGNIIVAFICFLIFKANIQSILLSFNKGEGQKFKGLDKLPIA